VSINSFDFILAFLPLTLILYQLLIRKGHNQGTKIWLILASLVFYGFAGLPSLVVLAFSVLVNYGLAVRAFPTGLPRSRASKAWLALGIAANVGLLAYLKYFNFILTSLDGMEILRFHPPETIVVLGISFISFQQISFLIDAYRGEIEAYRLLDYLLYITFFPKIVSGPITRYGDLVPQLQHLKGLNYENLSKGIYVFGLGLFKKVVIADTLAKLANAGFDTSSQLSLLEGWITSLSYTGQIYFDFSGYTDMAIGVALMLNLVLPFNFNSPYKATSIRDFWSRWHITLTKFLTDYIYIPLGGSRRGELKTMRNIMITFIVSGFWHGASWTFVFWGFLHGLASVALRLWNKTGLIMPRWLAWFFTFNFINVTWVFFRADTFADAMRVLQAMFFPATLAGLPAFSSFSEANLLLSLITAAVSIVILFARSNSNRFTRDLTPLNRRVYLVAALLIISVLFLNSSAPKEFIYNDF